LLRFPLILSGVLLLSGDSTQEVARKFVTREQQWRRIWPKDIAAIGRYLDQTIEINQIGRGSDC
jgi:hypothetical protein